MNKIYNHSCEDMHELADGSVHLTITSPPYNVGKEYEDDLTLQEHREFLSRVWKELYRVAADGGRLCVNILGTGRNPYIPLHSYITCDILDTGFLMHGEIIWNKGLSVGLSRAWGSWLSASSPVLRNLHENVLVFYKGEFGRKDKGKSTMSRDEFIKYTQSVWNIQTEHNTKIGHPTPFPVKLPFRLIQLYSYQEDLILDPFMGSGTTAVAATMLQRRWVGYEKLQKYIKLANDRLSKETYLFSDLYSS